MRERCGNGNHIMSYKLLKKAILLSTEVACLLMLMNCGDKDNEDPTASGSGASDSKSFAKLIIGTWCHEDNNHASGKEEFWDYSTDGRCVHYGSNQVPIMVNGVTSYEVRTYRREYCYTITGDTLRHVSTDETSAASNNSYYLISTLNETELVLSVTEPYYNRFVYYRDR